MGRELSDEEVAALGLEVPAPRGGARELSDEEAAQLGLEQPQKPSLPKTSAGGAFARGLANTYGTGDLIGAGLQALGEGGRAILSGEKGLLEYNPEVLATLKSAYRGNKRLTNADAEQHPIASIGGSVTGGVLAGPTLSAGGGLLRTMGTSAGFGALGRAASSDSETVGGRLLDAGVGGVAGAVGGGVGYGVAKAASPLLRYLSGKLKNVGINQGRRVLLSGADSLSDREMVPAEVVQEAFESGAIRPLGTTQEAFETLTKKSAEQRELYNQTMEELAKRGVRGPDAELLAQRLVAEGEALAPNTMNDALPAEYVARAEQVLRKQQLGSDGTSKSLGLHQAENIKRSLQDEARYGKREETSLNEVRRRIASMVRQANEDAIDEAGKAAGRGSEVEKLAGDFVPVKRRLGRLIGAEEAAERGATRASQRSSGYAPGKIELTTMAATGDPTALLAGPAQGFIKNRLTSLAASGAYSGSKGAARLAELIGAMPGGTAAGGGAAASRSLLDLLDDEEVEREEALRALRRR